MRTKLLIVLIWMVSLWSVAVAQQQPQRDIARINGDLYRFRNAGHFSVFLVTPAGIIATDLIDADAARWLKAELTKRLTSR